VDLKEISDITVGRLASWSAILIENHSTPGLLIGIGHDHRSGEIHLCIPEDLTQQDVQNLLVGAVMQVKGWR